MPPQQICQDIAANLNWLQTALTRGTSKRSYKNRTDNFCKDRRLCHYKLHRAGFHGRVARKFSILEDEYKADWRCPKSMLEWSERKYLTINVSAMFGSTLTSLILLKTIPTEKHGSGSIMLWWYCSSAGAGGCIDGCVKRSTFQQNITLNKLL